MRRREVGPRELQAQRYAQAGWPVFPCIPGEKVPATKQGFLDASTNPEQIHQWWAKNPERNIGIATGTPGPDVLDVDVYPDGTGYPAFNQLQRADLVEGAFAFVRTPSGGLHAYAKGSEQRNGHLAEQHIDFRSQGGYVLAPGSHVNEISYRVIKRQTPGAEGIDWNACVKELAPERDVPRLTPDAARERQADGKDAERLSGWLAGQTEGNRNHGLYYAANRLLEKGADPEALRDAARTACLADKEITRTINSARRTNAYPKAPAPEAEREAS